MDLGFDVNHVKHFLVINGGKVGYPDLIQHFKHYLSQPNTQNEARNAFRDYVNTLATVSIQENKKYLILRPQFMNQLVTDPSIHMRDVRTESLNTVGLPVVPIPEKRRSHSFNDENNGIEPKAPMRSKFNTSIDLNSGPINQNNQLSFSQQYSDVPPQPPPRRRSSTGGSKAKLEERLKQFHAENSEKENQDLSPPHQTEKLKEIHELTTKTPGRVKEHAQKINKMASLSELKPPMPSTTPQHSRPKSRSQTKDEDTDSGSVQTLDPLRRKWIISSSNCDYNALMSLLKEEPKLCGYKDFTSGYTALHWAAKFDKPNIIKLIAGTYCVDPNVKSFGGFTPLHLAAINKNQIIMELLTKTYNADPNIRDNSGKKPAQYLVNKLKSNVYSTGKLTNGQVSNQRKTDPYYGSHSLSHSIQTSINNSVNNLRPNLRHKVSHHSMLVRNSLPKRKAIKERRTNFHEF